MKRVTLNTSQANMIALARKGLLKMPESNSELADLMQSMFESAEHEPDYFDYEFNVLDAYMLLADVLQARVGKAYLSEIKRELMKKKKFKSLNLKSIANGEDLFLETTSKVITSGLATRDGKKIYLTKSGLELVKEIREARS